MIRKLFVAFALTAVALVAFAAPAGAARGAPPMATDASASPAAWWSLRVRWSTVR